MTQCGAALQAAGAAAAALAWAEAPAGQGQGRAFPAQGRSCISLEQTAMAAPLLDPGSANKWFGMCSNTSTEEQHQCDPCPCVGKEQQHLLGLCTGGTRGGSWCAMRWSAYHQPTGICSWLPMGALGRWLPAAADAVKQLPTPSCSGWDPPAYRGGQGHGGQGHVDPGVAPGEGQAVAPAVVPPAHSQGACCSAHC